MQFLRPSPILAVAAHADKLRALGKDIIVLGAGEPDFATPSHIAEAGIDAIRGGFTRYTAVDGIAELKSAIVAKFKQENGIQYDSDQILVSNGAKQAIYNLTCAILSPGDEAIILAPYWVTYPGMVRLAGAVPVIVNTTESSGFKVTATELEGAITPRTRLLFLNSPSNPTGATYRREEFRSLARVLERYPHVIIASDEIYEHIHWGSEDYCSFLSAAPELYERTVTINGCSKAYAMTGWRIGYCGGPADVIAAMVLVQEHSTSNPVSMSQKAAVAALSADQKFVSQMAKEFRLRHDFTVSALNTLRGVRCAPADGAFYAFPNVQSAVESLGLPDDEAFAKYLLDQAGVAVVPGSGFGAPGYVRLSFAASMRTLEAAITRLAKCLGLK